METVTITSTAPHALGFSTLALLAVGILAVVAVGWQLLSRRRTLRNR